MGLVPELMTEERELLTAERTLEPRRIDVIVGSQGGQVAGQQGGRQHSEEPSSGCATCKQR